MESARNPDLATRLFGASPERALALMRAAWPAAVGPELARRTEVVALDRGILRIRVPDTTWQRGLVKMRGDILARLRRVAGAAAPRALGFVEGPLSAPPPEEAKPARPPAGPPSAALVAAAQVIPDPALRAQFLAVAARYVARFPASGSAGAAGSTGSVGAATAAAGEASTASRG